MNGFFRNPRRILIVVHDLVVTVLAMLATLYVRFGNGENGGLVVRYPWLAVILPCYVVYAGIVYWYFHLYMAKWRFASLPDLRNIFRAVTVLAVSLLVLDYVLLYPGLFGTFFFGKITIALYWFLQMFFLGGPRIAYRLFRHVAHPAAGQKSRGNSDANRRARGGCRSAVARDRERRGQEHASGRNPVAVLGRSGPGTARRSGTRLSRRSGINRRCLAIARYRRRPAGTDAKRIGARSASGDHADAGAPARSRRQPDAVARVPARRRCGSRRSMSRTCCCARA